ncbi:MAG: hypothetical protein Q9167_007308 [Letrouitia subvulpina]
MALGKKSTADDPAKDVPLEGEKANIETRDGGYGYDPEKTEGRERKLSRIGGPAAIGLADSDAGSAMSVGKQVELESSNSIKGKLSDLLLQTAALLFSEYICLAIMSFPYSYSVLGLVPGLIITVVVAGLVLYTSLIVW